MLNVKAAIREEAVCAEGKALMSFDAFRTMISS